MFVNRIYHHAVATPDAIAVVSSGRRGRYRRFAQLIDAARAELIRTPPPAHGVVVEMGGNLLYSWVLLLALRSLGYTTLSASSWKIVEGLDLRGIGAMVCFADNQAAQATVAAARPDCPVVAIANRIVTARSGADHVPAQIEAGRFGDHIIYTSGTTGTYKKLCFAGDRLEELILHGIEGAAVRFIGGDQVYYNGNLGPWTIVGYRLPLAHWYHGAAVIFEQRPQWTEHVFDHRVTMAVLMPQMLRELCSSARTPPWTEPWRVVTGGGFIPADLAAQAVRGLGCELFINYGGSESRVALESRVRNAEDVVWLSPLFDGAAEIVDEDDRPVPRGEEGIIRIKAAPTDPESYLDDPEATARYFRGGYFYPGDMAVQRADDRVRVLGRLADVLTVRGNKLLIGPFEERARQQLEVTDLCLFVGQTDGGDEELLVAIEGETLPDPDKLDAMATAMSEHFARTRFAMVPRFPRSDTGMQKIDRRRLRRLVDEPEPG